MNKFDNILVGLLSPTDIEQMHNKGLSEREYRVDKLMRASYIDLLNANSTYDFETVYQSLLEAIYRNSFYELQPTIGQMKSQVSIARLPNLERTISQHTIKPHAKKQASFNIKTKRSLIHKTGELLIHSSFIGWFGIILAILGIYLTYIIYHDPIVNYCNVHLHWLHLK